MAHVLITHPKKVHVYTPIASIRKYTEPGFEAKLWRYAKSIFEHYYVFKFRFPLVCDEIPGNSYKPDLLLVSKSFQKWVIVEVELCKTPTTHTLAQIECFSNPKIDATKIADFIIRNNTGFKGRRQKLIDCFSRPSDLIIVLDDYNDIVFGKLRVEKKNLKICVLEVYKRPDYSYEGFRFGGDYPYELTNSSKLQYVDEQHFKIVKKDFARDLPKKFQLIFDKEPFDVSLIKASKKQTFLKMPDHNVPEDVYLQMGININNEYVIQKL